MKKARNVENRHYYRNPMTNLKPENYLKNTKAKMNFKDNFFFLQMVPRSIWSLSQKYLVSELKIYMSNNFLLYLQC